MLIWGEFVRIQLRVRYIELLILLYTHNSLPPSLVCTRVCIGSILAVALLFAFWRICVQCRRRRLRSRPGPISCCCSSRAVHFGNTHSTHSTGVRTRTPGLCMLGYVVQLSTEIMGQCKRERGKINSKNAKREQIVTLKCENHPHAEKLAIWDEYAVCEKPQGSSYWPHYTCFIPSSLYA